MKPLFLILTTLIHTCLCYISTAQQINIIAYTIEDGLVNNDVLNIYQDSQGFIWLCTRGGLSLYDGSRFTNYTTYNGLTNDMINDIYEIAPQKFIVAQNLGGPRILENSRIRPFPQNTAITVNRFYTDRKKHLFAVTDQSGIMEWQNNQFSPLNSMNTSNLQGMAMINDSLWAVIQQDYSVQIVTNQLHPFSALTIISAMVIYTDNQQRVWMGTKNGLKLLSTRQLPGKPVDFIPLPAIFNLSLLSKTCINNFLQDSRGNYWIGTINGLVSINQNGESKIFNEYDGLPSAFINCIYEDRQNNIWIGTPLGAAKFSLNNAIKTFTLNFGAAHDGTVFTSPVTENMTRIFDGKNINHLDLHTGKLTKPVMADSAAYQIFTLNKNELLVTNRTGATIYHHGQTHPEMIKWPDTRFSAVVRINQDNFIGSSGNGLYLISNGSTIKRLNLNVTNSIYTLLIDKKGVLLAGTQDEGLYKISVSPGQHPEQMEIIDTITGRLPDQHIRVLYADKENELWIGTRYKGLVRLLELPNRKYEIQNYGTHEGLSSDFVRAINRDTKGNIWAGTGQGIDKLIPAGNHYRIFNFGKANRIFSPAGNITFLKDDYLLATGYPYLIYARDKQLDTLSPPAVYITEVYSKPGESIAKTSGQLTRLPYNKAQINFDFSAPQFINETFTKYSYRLLGSNDTSWILSGKPHSIYFASLQPGNYSFEIKAMGFNGQWGLPAVHHFLVTPPFWQRAWFILLLIAAVALLAYSLYRYRIQQLLRLQKVRNRIATDLHDEIGSNLTNISILSNLSKKSLSQPQQATGFLTRISEEVASSSQALDDIIWSVNANHDTLEETVSRMRRYAAELFDAANISYNLHLDPVFEEKKLIMEQRRDIYLLYKEAVNNIFKHAQAQQVQIKITIEHNYLFLQISDDGKGFEPKKASERHGLKGMQERVKKWNGKIDIVSAVNRGASIQIRLPLATR